jgi:hypothetical protein
VAIDKTIWASVHTHTIPICSSPCSHPYFPKWWVGLFGRIQETKGQGLIKKQGNIIGHVDPFLVALESFFIDGMCSGGCMVIHGELLPLVISLVFRSVERLVLVVVSFFASLMLTRATGTPFDSKYWSKALSNDYRCGQ